MGVISQPPNNRWDAKSELHLIPFTLSNVSITFDKSGEISDCEVYIECVMDDPPTFANSVFTSHGGYKKGDLISVATLRASTNGSVVTVINDTPIGITAPKKVGTDPKTTFVIKDGDPHYRMRIFSNHTPPPVELVKGSGAYWDEIKEFPAITDTVKYEFPHTAGVIPAIVEMNILITKATFGGLAIGDVIPLKLIGGKQFPITGQPVGQQAIWSVSADKDKVYIDILSGTGSTGTKGSINFPSIKAPLKSANILITGQATWQMCIKNVFPNPNGVVFPVMSFATAKADTTNANSVHLPNIPVTPSTGQILEVNMTMYDTAHPEKVYYYNQCNGTVSPSYEKLNSALVSDRITDLSTGLQHDTVGLIFNGVKGAGAGVVIYDGTTTRNLWDAANGAWEMKYEWQYEGGIGSPDIDTGWQYVGKNELYYPKFNFDMSKIWTGAKLPSKVDLYLSINGVLPAHPTTISTSIISMSSLKGGGVSLRDVKGYLAWNNFVIVMSKSGITMANSADAEGLQGDTSIPGSPYIIGPSKDTYQCRAFDTWAGETNFRVCMYE